VRGEVAEGGHLLQMCAGEVSLAAGITRLLAAGCGCIGVKCGRDGAVVRAADMPAPAEVPGFVVEAQATVGAGDAFNAGFLFARALERDLVESARFGNVTAAWVVAAARGVLGSPTMAEVEASLATSLLPRHPSPNLNMRPTPSANNTCPR
jgi:sugar/nucleoside kinase (ribokinase family)